MSPLICLTSSARNNNSEKLVFHSSQNLSNFFTICLKIFLIFVWLLLKNCFRQILDMTRIFFHGLFNLNNIKIKFFYKLHSFVWSFQIRNYARYFYVTFNVYCHRRLRENHKLTTNCISLKNRRTNTCPLLVFHRYLYWFSNNQNSMK